MSDVKEESFLYLNTRPRNCKCRVEIELLPFLTSALDGGSGQLHTPACFIHEKNCPSTATACIISGVSM
jgi:hypothetical protein